MIESAKALSMALEYFIAFTYELTARCEVWKFDINTLSPA